MFGDREAYLDKFRTCARVRSRENQILGSDFYKREHTKPLFKKNCLLTIHNLYKYTCLFEMFKINKLESPISLLSLYQRSPTPWRTEYFITPSPSTSFIYQSSSMWNKCRKSSSIIHFSTPTNTVKSKLKCAILEMQSRYDDLEWSEKNFELKELTF